MAEFLSSSPTSTSRSSPLSPSPPPSIKASGAEVEYVLADIDKSHSEMVTRLRSMKEEMQSWRSKLDTQVKTYQSEISVLKSSLSSEVELLKKEFEGLRVNLQQHQEDVTNSLKSFGIEDASKEHENLKETENTEKTEDNNIPSGDAVKTDI
ncbi:hypothetical protein ZOSMA_108G00150 [Zostera marina]|uniref:CAP-Gly domain-containing linker protein 1 n=1 Tax=Zostera marina TaxID=29655 RepID=A0A0K9Q5U4_ZOSMR|nr:hypothetical protein ZOSMA_108G00150 [Zostera marina]